MAKELNTLAPKKWSGNYGGTTPNIDVTDSVLVGDLAIDTSTTPYYVWECLDNTNGAPVWIRHQSNSGSTSDSSRGSSTWTSTTSSPSQRAVEEAFNDVSVEYAKRASSLSSSDSGKFQVAYVGTGGIDGYTKLCLHCDGTNASTTFTDSSSTSKTITAYGDAQISTAQKKFGTASAYFDGTGDYLSTAYSSDFDFGSGDFTVDLWFRASSLNSNNHYLFGGHDAGSGYSSLLLIQNGSSLQMYSASSSGSSWDVASAVSISSSLSTDTWYHVAVARSGTSLRYFLDGNLVGTITTSATLYNNTAALRIGSSSAGEYFHGYIDEVRVSNGVARWTSSFTAPTSAYEYSNKYTLSTKKESELISTSGSAEISSLTEKTSPADNDVFILEDSAASYAKKYVKKSNLGGDSVVITITKTAHGFTSGDVNKPVAKLADGTYVLAKADSAEYSETVGIITSITDTSNFKVTHLGKYTWTSHGFTGPAIYLSAASAGALTETVPGYGNYAKPVAIVLDANTLEIIDRPAIWISGATPSISCQGRLTLTSGTPVTTADVTAATTVYLTPYNGNNVALYNGSAWVNYTFTERSLSLSGFTANTNYDIFLYNNSGTLTLSATAWTDATTRATALTTQDGIYVKSGATGYRYIGTIRTTSTIGQCEDSLTKRFVYNYMPSCRKPRAIYLSEGTSHNYTTGAWRAWNGSTTSTKVEFVVGVMDDALELNIRGYVSATSALVQVSAGFDGSTSGGLSLPLVGSGTPFLLPGKKTIAPSAITAGYHYLLGIEIGGTGATFGNFEHDFSLNM